MTQTLERQASGLFVQTSEGQQLAFPLKHTEVQARVAGNISRVEVTQRFENPFTTTLEAVYIFPLPDEAAVDDMLIRIGDRTIQGSIKKRQEAQQIYEQAKRQGQTAGLLEQERDNIFTQSLANIQPGEQIDVVIRYTDSLKFEGGNYEFVFPMVVGPRYIPGTTIEENAAGGGSAPAPMTFNQDTDLVPDASRLNAPTLPAGTRSRHDINVTVEIDAGVPIQNVESPSHQIQIEQEGQRVRVKLAGSDTIPNKDLMLRYQVAGDRTQTTVLAEADDRGGHFALYLVPALQYRSEQIVPKDMVFLIDTSGSQMGAPLFQCQELMRRFINGLNPDDTFSIIDFSDTTQHLSPVPLSNTPQNRSRATQYINQLNAGGGTEMLRGIQAVLNFPVTDPGRLRNIVLLTDGYIGNENQILTEVQRRLKPGNRLYSFGAGSSVNRFLLNRIAELGRGSARIIRHDEPTDEVVDRFFRQINNPVLANIQLQWEGGGESPVIYPTMPPDLFAEQPLVLFGRKRDRQAGKLHITGISAGGVRYQQTFGLNFEETGNPAIAQLWGRARIKDLTNQMVSGETKTGVEAVTDTALTYQLLSQYTAFVAVSDEVRVNPNQASISVYVPVEMPEAVSYEGVFGSTAYSPAPPTALPAPGGAAFRQRAVRAEAPQPMAAPVTQSTFRPESAPQAAPATGMPTQVFKKALAKAKEFIQPSAKLNQDEMDAELQMLQAPPRDFRTQSRESTPSSEELTRGLSEREVAADEGAFAEPEPFNQSAAEINRDVMDTELRMPQIPPSQAAPIYRLQVVSATGLDQNAIALLNQHLQSIQVPPDLSGEIRFELQLNKGRVRQVVLDEQASFLKEKKLIEAIRRSLITWRPPQTITGTIVLTLWLQ